MITSPVVVIVEAADAIVVVLTLTLPTYLSTNLLPSLLTYLLINLLTFYKHIKPVLEVNLNFQVQLTMPVVFFPPREWLGKFSAEI